MNTSKLKTHAPAARVAFIEAVTRRAGVFGIRDGAVEAVSETGDVAMIGGQAFPRSIVPLRKKLVERIGREGFDAVMDAAAYTWFNRLVAIRFMEIHGYFDHGFCVLSDPQGGQMPEILQKADQVALDVLDRDEVVRLKLAGNRDEELYRLLLTAQCQELNRVMPDVFGKLDDETLLLLPDNLLHSDSLVRQLVAASDPADWQEVEVLGWLYQFYISEKKDAVMGRKSAVPKEDIPAVTQLFTPHWIVRYLVENSLGRLWLLNRPHSKLREHMPYYIEGENTAPGGSPAETDFLRITKPEDIRLCDPAVGSGHMLTYAFDLLYLIYEEEGYAPGDIPGLILKHNLTGLEICPRAAQLAEIALVFKAREKARRFFQSGQFVRPNIFCLQDVRFGEGELRDYIAALKLGDLFDQPVLKLMHQFEEATNFGSLIQPCLDGRAIADLRSAIEAKDIGGQLFLRETHRKVLRALEQAEALTQRYHVVAANPPYMGSKYFNAKLKSFVGATLPQGRADSYGAFIVRNLGFAVPHGVVAMVTIPNWMFLSSFEDLRTHLLEVAGIDSLVHNGRGVWGSDFGSCSFVIRRGWQDSAKGVFKRLFTRHGDVASNEELVSRFFSPDWPNYRAASNDFRKIPGAPITYWLSSNFIALFDREKIGATAEVRAGLTTGNTDRHLRYWWEICLAELLRTEELVELPLRNGFNYLPYNKGGEYRKWYGNREYVLRFGQEAYEQMQGEDGFRADGISHFLRPSLTWAKITMGDFSCRYTPPGSGFDATATSVFAENSKLEEIGLLLNSKVGLGMLNAINSTIVYLPRDVKNTPSLSSPRLTPRLTELVLLARADWDNFETSWDFRDHPFLRPGLKGATLEASWRNWEAQSTAAIRRMQELETENNRLFIAAYGLEGELSPEVPEEQITLARADQAKDAAAFLSYAVGCMMGRYSLDQPGLILADAGATLQDYLAKVSNPTLTPDADGIIPLTEHPWFDDDAASRLEEFLVVTFGRETLEENLQWLATSLGAKPTEPARAGLRRYFADTFFSNHLSGERAYGYKNRPIYWIFSSGKQQAFQCLVYLHRYTPGTLARMRTEYLIPLQGKIAARIQFLGGDPQEEGQGGEIGKASSTPERRKLEKRYNFLIKQQTELRAFDEQLRHYADQRIALDLDDGVKVNYAKFGPLVAEAKKVCGKKEE